MSFAALFNEKAHEQALDAQRNLDTLTVQDRAGENGLIASGQAPDESKTETEKKKKARDSEAFRRQIMLQRMLEDMQAMLDDISAAITATSKIKDLIKKKELDVNNLDHLELLLIAGIDPKLAENGELTAEIAEKHEDKLKVQKSDFEKVMKDAENLDINDPDFDEKIKKLNDYSPEQENSYFSGASVENKQKILEAAGLDINERDLVSKIASFSDDFEDDFSEENKVSISAATDIQGAAIRNAPDLKGNFTAATSPQVADTKPAANNDSTPTVTATKLDLS